MEKIVGICDKSYPSQRLIIGKTKSVRYKNVKQKNQLFIYILVAIGKLIPRFRISNIYAKYVHFHLNAFKDDEITFIHTFNRICVNPYFVWGGSFEKTFPEYFSDESVMNVQKLRLQSEFLLKDNCKFLLPISDWALNYEKWMLEQIFTKEQIDIIFNKTRVLYPPQEVLITEDEIINKYKDVESRELTFIYVGGQVKRKGGVSTLKVFNKLAQFYHFKVIFIGDLNNGYNSYTLSEEEKRACKAIINNSNWLEFYQQMDNTTVLEKMKQSDVGLLPTIGDTFGFSVLEMQASGCPVITTNRQAMPEINNYETGWVISTKEVITHNGDDYGNYTLEEINDFLSEIDKQLEKIVISILENPSQVKTKAIRALRKVTMDNSPTKYEETLKELYDTL